MHKFSHVQLLVPIDLMVADIPERMYKGMRHTIFSTTRGSGITVLTYVFLLGCRMVLTPFALVLIL